MPTQEEQNFKARYKDEAAVMAAFKPENGSRILFNEQELPTLPTVMLGRLDGLYSVKGTAQFIVKRYMRDIYKQSGTIRTVDDETIDSAARSFYGNHGAKCGIYACALYFAAYTARFKSENVRWFSPEDVLKRYSTVFTAYWAQLKQKATEQPKPVYTGPTGDEARGIWIRRRVKQDGYDKFINESGLIRMGRLTVADVDAALAEANEIF